MTNSTPKLTHTELYNIIANFVGTTFISIHSVTSNKGQFNQGRNGSRKAVDKMINVLGWDAKAIRKEQTHNFMLTSCGFDTMIERARTKKFDAELEFLGIDLANFIKSLSFMKNDSYVLGERKNGTSVNPYLVLSKKDEHPMMNVYPSKLNRKSPVFWVNGKQVDADILAPFKSASYGKASKKQIEFGLDADNTVRINNFRFENIRHMTMKIPQIPQIKGKRYEIVPD